jgi:hypothetical protein
VKLSLWQQFSSNHSGHFTVVGSFPSEAEAITAEEQFHTLFQAILAWKAIPENKASIEEQERISYSSSATPPEVDIAQKYSIEKPSQTIDWLDSDLDENLFRIGADVLVNVEFETWQSPTLVQSLITALGGILKTQIRDHTYLTLHLTCFFPDEASAQAILQESAAFIKSPIGKRSPWTWKGEYSGVYGFGKIQARESQIIIVYQFFRFHPGFVSMLEWLRKAGAENIEYTLTEEKEWGEVP